MRYKFGTLVICFLLELGDAIDVFEYASKSVYALDSPSSEIPKGTPLKPVASLPQGTTKNTVYAPTWINSELHLIGGEPGRELAVWHLTNETRKDADGKNRKWQPVKINASKDIKAVDHSAALYDAMNNATYIFSPDYFTTIQNGLVKQVKTKNHPDYPGRPTFTQFGRQAIILGSKDTAVVFNLDDKTWDKKTIKGFPARYGHTAVKAKTGNDIILLGGAYENGTLIDRSPTLLDTKNWSVRYYNNTDQHDGMVDHAALMNNFDMFVVHNGTVSVFDTQNGNWSTQPAHRTKSEYEEETEGGDVLVDKPMKNRKNLALGLGLGLGIPVVLAFIQKKEAIESTLESQPSNNGYPRLYDPEDAEDPEVALPAGFIPLREVAATQHNALEVISTEPSVGNVFALTVPTIVVHDENGISTDPFSDETATEQAKTVSPFSAENLATFAKMNGVDIRTKDKEMEADGSAGDIYTTATEGSSVKDDFSDSGDTITGPKAADTENASVAETVEEDPNYDPFQDPTNDHCNRRAESFNAPINEYFTYKVPINDEESLARFNRKLENPEAELKAYSERMDLSYKVPSINEEASLAHCNMALGTLGAELKAYSKRMAMIAAEAPIIEEATSTDETPSSSNNGTASSMQKRPSVVRHLSIRNLLANNETMGESSAAGAARGKAPIIEEATFTDTTPALDNGNGKENSTTIEDAITAAQTLVTIKGKGKAPETTTDSGSAPTKGTVDTINSFLLESSNETPAFLMAKRLSANNLKNDQPVGESSAAGAALGSSNPIEPLDVADVDGSNQAELSAAAFTCGDSADTPESSAAASVAGDSTTVEPVKNTGAGNKKNNSKKKKKGKGRGKGKGQKW
ncbi:Protein of unknown function [Pyronema omphalodes CBS 100304]|uniref:Uncharacterized protein n=1 Tax=Pyronema omphalodes (strain CBS 100304) TaxID=1076935 RepID=U4KU94_PYROM|nr:Protein of unknown function [Pyronema omphalodes CBS 100304]